MRNHYVPKFLQRPWTDPADHKLEVFRIGERGIENYRQTPKGNGYEDDMLTLTEKTVAGMDRHAIESVVLQQVDNQASTIRHKMEHEGLASLNNDERSAWARFIMSIRLRQPSIVDYLRTESALTLREHLADTVEEYQTAREPHDAPTLEAWADQHFPGLIENFGLSFFHKLIDDPDIGTKLIQLRWWLYDFSACDHSLLLADHPCIFAGGIDDPNLAVVLPISPSKAFMATRGEATARAIRAASPRELVRRVNDASVRQATKYVYAVNDRQKVFVADRWRTPAKDPLGEP